MNQLKHILNKHRLEAFVVLFLIVVAMLYFSNGTRAQAPPPGGYDAPAPLDPSCSGVIGDPNYDPNCFVKLTGGDFSDGGEVGEGDRTLGNTDNFDLGFITNNLIRLHIQDDGYVGIGTTDPAYPLHVDGEVRIENDLFIGDGDLELSDNRSVKNQAGNLEIQFTELEMLFKTEPLWGVPGIERMRIDKDGNVGIGTVNPGTSNLLELSSTSKGFILPRMTKAQRNAISSPVEGMMIYQTDNTPGLRVYNGTNWMKFTEATDD